MNRSEHILLVEDNPMDVILIHEAFSGIRLADRVISVDDGVEALDYLYSKGQYDGRHSDIPVFILLDIKMPRIDGIEVLRAIREDPKFKIVPVVMFTSSREECDIQKCYELGVNAYVVKPVNSKEYFNAAKHIGLFWGLLNELPIEGR